MDVRYSTNPAQERGSGRLHLVEDVRTPAVFRALGRETVDCDGIADEPGPENLSRTARMTGPR